jgi:hypothetical protein
MAVDHLSPFIDYEFPLAENSPVPPSALVVVYSTPINQTDLAECILQALVVDKVFVPKDHASHAGRWNSVNLHQSQPPQPIDGYEKSIISLFNCILHCTYLLSSSEKSNEGSFLMKDKTRIFSNTSMTVLSGSDFRQVLSLLQIKYRYLEDLSKLALKEILNNSWFMFDQQDNLLYVLGATLCGPRLIICLIDYGGCVFTENIDVESNPLDLICYLSFLALHQPQDLGQDSSFLYPHVTSGKW